MRSFAALLVLSAALAACAATADSAGHDESDIATTSTIVACSETFGSDDGTFVVYASCDGGGAKIIRNAVVSNYAPTTIAQLAATDKVMSLGTMGRFVWYVVRHADFKSELVVAELGDGPFPHVTLTPIALTQINAMIVHDVNVMKDGTIAFIGYRNDLDRESLIVAKTGQSTPILNESLGGDSNSRFSLTLDPYSRELLIDGDHSSFRVLRLESGGPVLGPAVRAQMPIDVMAKDSFALGEIIGRVRTGEHEESIARVNVKTGAVTVLSAGFWESSGLIASKNDVWHASRRNSDGQYVLEHIHMALGTAPVKTTLATDPDLIWARISADGSALLFSTGRQGAANALGVVASDGATPAHIVIPKSENLNIQIHGQGRSPKDTIAPRALVETRNVSTYAEQMRLVDDRTGNMLGTWSEGVDYENGLTFALSGNGEALYDERPCNSAGAAKGTMVMQLWPSATAVTSCMTDAAYMSLAPVSDSSSAMLYRSTQGGPQVVTVVRP